MKKSTYDVLHDDITYAIHICADAINKDSNASTDVQNSKAVLNLVEVLDMLESNFRIEEDTND